MRQERQPGSKGGDAGTEPSRPPPATSSASLARTGTDEPERNREATDRKTLTTPALQGTGRANVVPLLPRPVTSRAMCVPNPDVTGPGAPPSGSCSHSIAPNSKSCQPHSSSNAFRPGQYYAEAGTAARTAHLHSLNGNDRSAGLSAVQSSVPHEQDVNISSQQALPRNLYASVHPGGGVRDLPPERAIKGSGDGRTRADQGHLPVRDQRGELTPQSITDFMRLQAFMTGDQKATVFHPDYAHSPPSSLPRASVLSSTSAPLPPHPGTMSSLSHHHQAHAQPIYSHTCHHSSRSFQPTLALATGASKGVGEASRPGGIDYQYNGVEESRVHLQHPHPNHYHHHHHPSHPAYSHALSPYKGPTLSSIPHPATLSKVYAPYLLQREHRSHPPPSFPGESFSLPVLSKEDEKKRFKRALNRESAQRCRKRKRDLVEDLIEANKLFSTHAAILDGLGSTCIEFEYSSGEVISAHGTKQVLGWPSPSLRGRCVYDLLVPESKTRVQRLMSQLVMDWQAAIKEASSSRRDAREEGRDILEGASNGNKAEDPGFTRSWETALSEVSEEGSGERVTGREGADAKRSQASTASSSFSSSPSCPATFSGTDAHSDHSSGKSGDKSSSEEAASESTESNGPANLYDPVNGDSSRPNVGRNKGTEEKHRSQTARALNQGRNLTEEASAGLEVAAAMAELAKGYRRDADGDEEDGEEDDGEASSMDSCVGHVDEREPPPLKGGGSRRTKAAVAAAAVMADKAGASERKGSSGGNTKPGITGRRRAHGQDAQDKEGTCAGLPSSEKRPPGLATTGTPRKTSVAGVSGIGLGGKATVSIPTAGGRVLTRDVWELAQVPCALPAIQGREDASEPSGSSSNSPGTSSSQTFTSREPGSSTNSNIAQILPAGHPASNEFMFQIANVTFKTQNGGARFGDINGVVTLDGQGAAEVTQNSSGPEAECVWSIRFHDGKERAGHNPSWGMHVHRRHTIQDDINTNRAEIAIMGSSRPVSSSSASATTSSSSSSSTSSLSALCVSSNDTETAPSKKGATGDNDTNSFESSQGGGSHGSDEGSFSSSDDNGPLGAPHGSAKMPVTTFRSGSSNNSMDNCNSSSGSSGSSGRSDGSGGSGGGKETAKEAMEGPWSRASEPSMDVE